MQDTQAALKVINKMQEAGVIPKYAIGGHYKVFSPDKLNEILARHKLVEKWRRFDDKYIKGNS